MTNEITILDRQKAKRIIDDLWRDHGSKRIAKLLGINQKYIGYARRMELHIKDNSRAPQTYICPKEAIRKILEYGTLMGARRSSDPTIRQCLDWLKGQVAFKSGHADCAIVVKIINILEENR